MNKTNELILTEKFVLKNAIENDKRNTRIFGKKANQAFVWPLLGLGGIQTLSRYLNIFSSAVSEKMASN